MLNYHRYMTYLSLFVLAVIAPLPATAQVSGLSSSVTFVDAESPSGTMDGVNAAFPDSSANLYREPSLPGVRLQAPCRFLVQDGNNLLINQYVEVSPRWQVDWAPRVWNRR